MILAIDAGNSRVKWALHDGRDFVREGWAASADPAALARALAQLPAPAGIAVANVAGDTVRAVLERVFANWTSNVRWVVGARSQAGVTSRYDDPSQLGADRWSALIGARSLFPGPCLVANAGTAMTVDALSAAGEFLGGVIVPGFDLMHEALATNTARLSAQRGAFVAFPRNTRDAITSGAVQALCGTVERMRAALAQAAGAEPTLVLSGGAAQHVAAHLDRPVQRVEKLVLHGLVRIAREAP
jgi:type III pantothenate kinase